MSEGIEKAAADIFLQALPEESTAVETTGGGMVMASEPASTAAEAMKRVSTAYVREKMDRLMLSQNPSFGTPVKWPDKITWIGGAEMAPTRGARLKPGTYDCGVLDCSTCKPMRGGRAFNPPLCSERCLSLKEENASLAEAFAIKNTFIAELRAKIERLEKKNDRLIVAYDELARSTMPPVPAPGAAEARAIGAVIAGWRPVV